MIGLLEPTTKEIVLGQAEVRQLFRVPKAGVIAGCMVTDGSIKRTAEVRLIRDNVVIYTGKARVAPQVQGRRFRGQIKDTSAASESRATMT